MAAPKLQPDSPAYIVTTHNELTRVVNAYAKRGKQIYADTETTGLNPRAGKLIAIQMWQGVGLPVIVDWRRMDDPNMAAMLLGEDGPLHNLRWVFHNAAFDLSWLGSAGIWLNKVYDTQIAEQVLTGANEGLALKDLAYKYAQFDMSKDGREWFYDLDTRVDMVTGGPPDYLEYEVRPWDEPFPDEIVEYMANDVLHLPTIVKSQVRELRLSGLLPTAELEMRVVPAISYMQGCGVRIDVDKWRGIIQEQAAEAARLEEELLTSDLAMAIQKERREEYNRQKFELEWWQEAQAHAIEDARRHYDEQQMADEGTQYIFYGCTPEPGEKWGSFKKRAMAAWKELNARPPTPKADLLTVNLGSSQQLKAGLSLLGIDLPDTEKETLEKAAPRFPVLKPLLAQRQAAKFVSTYGEKLLARVEDDGRIHPSYQQIGAETGRMSCRQP